MLVDTEILIAWGAVSKKYKKNEIIFLEGDMPRYYHQIISGKVKVCNHNDTKELTQGIFTNGESFGEPPIFVNDIYPVSAVALTETVVIKILKERFFKLMDEYPPIQKKIMQLFALRIYEKSILAKELINNSPEERIIRFLENYKKKAGANNGLLQIDFTRQEIANFTGLCVETVIRTLTKMNAQKKVSIVNKKLYY